ncbi:MAG TPA: hypothetical protein VGK62_02415 [Gaiellaceae bacterium]
MNLALTDVQGPTVSALGVAATVDAEVVARFAAGFGDAANV